MRCTVVDNTADRILAIIDRNKSVTVPSLAENLSSVKRVLVLNDVYRFRGSYSVGVVYIILLFARNVNRADDITVAIVDIEKLRTSYKKCGEKHVFYYS